MRWSIIRLIWLRELRDQVRDRRTLFMIVVLPIFLYPVAGLGLMLLALVFVNRPGTVGIGGAETLPPLTARSAGFDPGAVTCWLALTPAVPGSIGLDRVAGAVALVAWQHSQPG